MLNRLFKILLIPIIGLLFSGCYTALWMPDQDYNSDDIQANEGENYYQLNDYGDYYYYYNRPWWYDAVQAAQQKKSTKDDNNLRNSISGRTDFNRTGRGQQVQPTNTPLPTVSAPAPATTSASTTTSTSNSGNRVESSNTSTQNTRSSNNDNPVRNNDGNRKTNGR